MEFRITILDKLALLYTIFPDGYEFDLPPIRPGNDMEYIDKDRIEVWIRKYESYSPEVRKWVLTSSNIAYKKLHEFQFDNVNEIQSLYDMMNDDRGYEVPSITVKDGIDYITKKWVLTWIYPPYEFSMGHRTWINMSCNLIYEQIMNEK